MKILHLTGRFSTGGAEKLLLDIIPRFADKVEASDLLLIDGTITPFYEALKNKRKCNIYSLGNSLYNLINIIRIIKYLKRYDIVHVHLFPGLYFVALAKLLSLSKVKLVYTEHNTANRRLDSTFFSFFDGIIYRFYTKVICVAPEVQDVLTRKHPFLQKKTTTIVNGIDLIAAREALAASRKVFGYLQEDKLLIMVARFERAKDQDTLVRTLTKLPERYKLLLVGDGTRMREVQELVSRLEVGGRVSLLGQRSDVYSLMKMSDVAVLSSHHEGMSLSALEAMACGIPLVAANVEGLSGIVSECGGVLFEQGSEEDLSDKILSLESERFYEEVRRRQNTRISRYDIDKNVSAILDLYRWVVSE